MLSVYLDDGEPDVRVPVDIARIVDPSGYAYIGFTASTGNGYENHDILRWSFRAEKPDVSSRIEVVESQIRYLPPDCLEQHSLCTPEQGTVEELAADRYRLIIPSHLPWPVSIPDSAALPVRIESARGYVCLDGSNPDSCVGPDGTPDPAGAAQLLDPASPAGALIVRTESGRTSFSVNGRKGRKARSHQGYFEVLVSLEATRQ